AQLGIVAFGGLAYPLYDVLVAMGYGLLLPGIAVLHVRHAAARQSGAILATIAGAAVATVGLAGSAHLDVRPASLFVLGLGRRPGPRDRSSSSWVPSRCWRT